MSDFMFQVGQSRLDSFRYGLELILGMRLARPLLLGLRVYKFRFITIFKGLHLPIFPQPIQVNQTSTKLTRPDLFRSAQNVWGQSSKFKFDLRFLIIQH